MIEFTVTGVMLVAGTPPSRSAYCSANVYGTELDAYRFRGNAKARTAFPADFHMMLE